MSTTTQGSLEQSKTPLIVHDTGSSVARSVVATNTTRKPGKSTVTITTLNAPPPSTIASSKPSFFIQNAVALDPTIVTNAAMAAANIWNPTYVLRPHFNDVIFPVEDYPMWIGNIKFRNEVIKRQLQFYNSVDRAEQAKLALEIVHSIQEQRPPGRFVLALPWRPPSAVIVEGAQMQRDNNNNNHKKPGPGGLPPYLENTIFQVMNETDVLIQLGKHLRRIECHRVKRFIKKKKKRTPKNNNPEILKHKYADFFLDSDDEEEEEEKEENDQEEADAVPTKKIPIESLGPLQVLYYVPQHHQQQRQNKYQNSTTGKHYPDDAVSMQSSNASSSSPSQLRKKRNKQAASRRFATNEPLSKKFRTEPKPQTGATVEESTQSLVVVVPPPLTGQFEEGKNDTNKAKEKPPKATSLMVLSQNEGTNILPKGVTVRPSGKWQAQTYFAGQSRYVGVYDTSVLAAHAYNMVQSYLSEYRKKHKVNKETSKETLGSIFAKARQVADESVALLRERLEKEERQKPKQKSPDNHPPEKQHEQEGDPDSSEEHAQQSLKDKEQEQGDPDFSEEEAKQYLKDKEASLPQGEDEDA